MKQNILTLLFLAILLPAISQNYVSNGDFEIYTECPSQPGQLTIAESWYSHGNQLADYYHLCSATMPIPSNSHGFQFANSFRGYAGIFLSDFTIGPDVREYITSPLNVPLVSGKTYQVQFYVSLANNSGYAVTPIGALLSADTTFEMSGSLIINQEPQIVNLSNVPVTDTLHWTLISGIFVAAGDEAFITIGNFENEGNSGTQVTGGVENSSYYYIDDVSVVLFENTSINKIDEELKIFPNPVNGFLTISYPFNKDEQVDLIVRDIVGNIILESSVIRPIEIIKLDTNGIIPGMYFLEINQGRKQLQKTFIKGEY